MNDDELERRLRIAPPHQLSTGFAARVARHVRPEKVVHPLEGLVGLVFALAALAVVAGPLGRVWEALPTQAAIGLAAFFSMIVVDRVLAGMSFPKKRYPRSAP